MKIPRSLKKFMNELFVPCNLISVDSVFSVHKLTNKNINKIYKKEKNISS